MLRFFKVYYVDSENDFQIGRGVMVEAYILTFCFFNSVCFRTSYPNTYCLSSFRFFRPLI